MSLAYGAKALSANISLKNKELFYTNGLESFLHNNYEDVNKAFNQVLNNEIIYQYPREKINKLVNKHFDNIEKYIKGNKENKKDWASLYNEIMLMMPKSIKIINERDKNQDVVRIEEKKKQETVQQLNIVNNELQIIKNSNAFKIGKYITWLPHVIKSKFK